MTNDELERSLRQLRLGGMAQSMTTRAQQARADSLGPLDFLGLLVHDEIERRRDRLIGRRVKRASFRDHKTLDAFDFGFNPSIDRALIFELATCRFIERREQVLVLGNAGCGKSHLAQALGMAAIHAGFGVLYREAHLFFEEIALATHTNSRADCMQMLAEMPLLIVDDLGMRKPPVSAAEDLLELMMRRYERVSTIVTSNRPLEDWPELFGDAPAVAAFLDRMMHHSHLIQIKGKSYRLHESALAHRQRDSKGSKTGT
jgi:DNA replication protein DnaC